jgi:serine/threonine protein kinase
MATGEKNVEKGRRGEATASPASLQQSGGSATLGVSIDTVIDEEYPIKDRLDRFELIAELAVGGMGSVYLARLSGAGGFQRLYAIKRLHDHLAKNEDFISMFLDEARLAARIHHPNVVPIVEIDTTEAGYYLVMEYIEGDTVWQLFNRGAKTGKRIPDRVAIRIALDSLSGLHAAHELRDDDGKPLEIVHRDVSPHNILVGVDGVSRITDFGIARAATRLAVTQSGQLKGKLAYMAPEQARSETVDRRADVFSMGICLWEMLAGQRLFKSEFEAETLNRLLYDPIPKLTSLAPAVPAAVEAVCMKALTRDPDKRFATAAEFGDALEQAARRHDLIGGKREVSSSVDEVLGSDLAERRQALRAWRVESDPNRTTSAGSPSIAPPFPSPVSDGGSGPREPRGPETSGLMVAPATNRGATIGVALLAAGLALASSMFEWNRAQAQERETGRLTRPAASVLPAPLAPSSPSLVAKEMIGQPAEAAQPSAATTSVAPPPPSVASAPARPATPASRPPSPKIAPPPPSDMMVNPYR